MLLPQDLVVVQDSSTKHECTLITVFLARPFLRIVAYSVFRPCENHSCRAQSGRHGAAELSVYSLGKPDMHSQLSWTVQVSAPIPLSPQALFTQSTASGQNFPAGKSMTCSTEYPSPDALASASARARISLSISFNRALSTLATQNWILVQDWIWEPNQHVCPLSLLRFLRCKLQLAQT